MSKEGIDYGLGHTNIDKSTGIRYGVISAHTVGEAWYDEAEADYGTPTCPKCGDAAFHDGYPEEYTHAPHESPEYVCVSCRYVFGSESAFSDEPLGYFYDDDGYYLTDCLDSDIMVCQSPYYTFARYCSPCVPGAGDLNGPVPSGVKTYCLGHDWFEDGKAPYRVFSVADGTEVMGASLGV